MYEEVHIRVCRIGLSGVLMACGGKDSAPAGPSQPDPTGVVIVECADLDELIEQAALDAAAVGSSAWWQYVDPVELEPFLASDVATECGFMTRHVVDVAAHPDAVCNDGTPAVYYHQVGATDPDKWVVYLKGGSGCFSEAACQERWTGGRFNDLMTSSESFWGPIGQSMLSGLLSDDPADNPDLAGWTKVWMLYCSSDGWSGARAGSGPDKPIEQTWEAKVDGGGDPDIAQMYEQGTWHFQGAAIVDAVFAELLDPTALGADSLDAASRLVIAGSSAGASGVRNHVDRLRDQVLPTGLDVRALHDAGWYPPSVNPDPTAVSDGMVAAGYDPADVAAWGALAGADTYQRLVDIGVDPTWLGALDTPDGLTAFEIYAGSLRYGVDYVGAAENMDADCIARTDGSTGALPSTERWLCLEPYVGSGFIDTPLFVYQDQHDPTDMGRVLLSGGDPVHQDAFATGVRAVVQAADGCFSPRLCTHEAAHDADIWTGGDVEACGGTPAATLLSGRAYRDAVTDWLFDRGGEACSVQP